MAKKRKKLTVTHYVCDSGSGTVSQSLMRAKSEDFEDIFEHPDTSCFDLRGHLEKLPLYEVPARILAKLKAARVKGDMIFREFVRHGDGSINEVPEADVEPKAKRSRKDRASSEKIVFPGNESAALAKAKGDLARLRAKVKFKTPVSRIAEGAPVS